jgi:hypothetical protein
MCPDSVTDQNTSAGGQVLACRREGGEQASEGMRGPDTDDQVERVWGSEVRGTLVVEDEALLKAQDARGPPSMCQRALGGVDTLRPQLRVRGQGTQEPLTTSAAEVKYTGVASRDAAFQQLAHRVVVERGRNRMIRMGKPGDLFTVHRRSLA